MRKLMIPLLVALVLSGPLHAQTDPDSLLRSEIRAAAAEADLPGGAVALVRPDVMPLYVTFGGADREDGPIGPESVFRVGSVSKVISAAAIATLVAAEQVGLDEDLRPRAEWVARAAGDDAITLRQLLTHTSGLDDYVVGMFARDASEVVPLEEYLAARKLVRTTEPGRWTRYSNHGASLAGWVAADQLRTDFAAAVRRQLFAPLGMSDSEFAQPAPERLLQRLARAFPCHDRDCEPHPLDYRHTPPAGAMLTTPANMTRFLEAVLAGRDGPLGAAAGLLTSRAWGPRGDMPGLALALQEQPIGGHRGLVHSGSSSGYKALMALVPETGMGLFAVTTGGASSFGAEIMRLFAELQPPARSEVEAPWLEAGHPEPVSEDERSSLAGAYLVGRASHSSYESFPGLFLFSQSFGFDEGGWLVQRTGGRSVRYGRIRDDLFAEIDGPGRLSFERDASGDVVAVHAPDEFFGVRYPATYLRLPWWSEPGFMNELLSWAIALPVFALVGWLLSTAVRALVRRIRGAERPVARPAWPEMAAAAIATGFVLLVGFGFLARFNTLAMSDPQSLAYGLPEGLSRNLVLVWPSAVFTLLCAGLTARAWTRWRSRRYVDLAALTVTSICLLLFAGLMVHFHLLPPAG